MQTVSLTGSSTRSSIRRQAQHASRPLPLPPAGLARSAPIGVGQLDLTRARIRAPGYMHRDSCKIERKLQYNVLYSLPGKFIYYANHLHFLKLGLQILPRAVFIIQGQSLKIICFYLALIFNFYLFVFSVRHRELARDGYFTLPSMNGVGLLKRSPSIQIHHEKLS